MFKLFTYTCTGGFSAVRDRTNTIKVDEQVLVQGKEKTATGHISKNTLQCAKEQKAEYPGGGSGGNKANKEIQNCKVFEAAVTF